MSIQERFVLNINFTISAYDGEQKSRNIKYGSVFVRNVKYRTIHQLHFLFRLSSRGVKHVEVVVTGSFKNSQSTMI